MNDKKNDTKLDGSSDGSTAKKISPVVLAAISVGAIAAGLLTYFATTRLISDGASPCEAAKAEILAVKALAPDPATLNTRPDLSLRLSNAGKDLQSYCIYIDGRQFETLNVDSWLGIAPPPSTPPVESNTTLEPVVDPTVVP